MVSSNSTVRIVTGMGVWTGYVYFVRVVTKTKIRMDRKPVLPYLYNSSWVFLKLLRIPLGNSFKRPRFEGSTERRFLTEISHEDRINASGARTENKMARDHRRWGSGGSRARREVFILDSKNETKTNYSTRGYRSGPVPRPLFAVRRRSERLYDGRNRVR